MIRMPTFPVRQNHHPWPGLADDAGNFESVLPCVLDPAVRDVERPALADAENACRIGGLARPVFRRATSAHFALSKVEDAGALPALRHFEQRTAAGLFYVIAVRRNCQNIQRNRGHD